MAKDGAVVTEQAGRIRVRFTPEARQAVEKVAVNAKPYVERVEASDNLRYALGEGETAQPAQPAFGTKPAGQ